MRQHRTFVELPEDLAASLHAHAEVNGTTASEMCYHWLVEAARLALEGHGHLLPQVPLIGGIRRAPRGAVGPTKVVRWKQGPAEFNRFRDLIDDAGSTVPAVLREAAGACVAAGGDVLAMTWPPKSALAAAA